MFMKFASENQIEPEIFGVFLRASKYSDILNYFSVFKNTK